MWSSLSLALSPTPSAPSALFAFTAVVAFFLFVCIVAVSRYVSPIFVKGAVLFLCDKGTHVVVHAAVSDRGRSCVRPGVPLVRTAHASRRRIHGVSECESRAAGCAARFYAGMLQVCCTLSPPSLKQPMVFLVLGCAHPPPRRLPELREALLHEDEDAAVTVTALTCTNRSSCHLSSLRAFVTHLHGQPRLRASAPPPPYPLPVRIFAHLLPPSFRQQQQQNPLSGHEGTPWVSNQQTAQGR